MAIIVAFPVQVAKGERCPGWNYATKENTIKKEGEGEGEDGRKRQMTRGG